MQLTSARFRSLLLFLAVGLPAFALAIPVNYALVVNAEMAPAPAYALVLALQVTVNFFLVRYFVFKRRVWNGIGREFVQFMVSILGVRLLDWAVYVVAVDGLGVYFLLVQLVNVVFFSVLKFLLSERIMR
jgi:putative flippase GtrA